ncbi:hypothetical protein [Anaerofustis stercorihominis]|uniref:hypothetical protein n=1 Tax=Anaerofustis stercorihominis TaxID=214853 RepID=UPI003991493B
MDLIYADRNFKDLGIIIDYTLDYAFGYKENDFELTLDIENHCLENGYFIYFDNTEIGGVIDTICPNTENDTITYKGRSWHGILENKIISPDENQDYLIVSGNAHDVLNEIIETLDISDLFKVSEEVTDIEIDDYKFERYIPAYSAILKMLRDNNAKLDIVKEDKYIILTVVANEDYSDDEEWTNSIYTFQIERKYRPTNHLICLGSGDLQNRKLIHLFTDENGGLQPYTNVDNPYMDSHYILDKSSQFLFGSDEVCEVYDNGNSNVTENYILLTSQPKDWSKKYTDYYYLDEEEDSETGQIKEVFKEVEPVTTDMYTLQTSKPTDWNENYSSYFIEDKTTIEKSYKSVEGAETNKYTKVSKKPRNWDLSYSNYYYYYNDGTTAEYRQVSADNKTTYKLQTMKPSDWTGNWKSYYKKVKVYKYKYTEKKRKNKRSVWKKSTVYKNSKVKNVKTSTHILTFIKKVANGTAYKTLETLYKKRPAWKKKKFCTQSSKTILPKWKNNYYYKVSTTITAPTWKSNTYYTQTAKSKTIPFKKNTYYKKYLDNYADLVENGIKKLKESYDCDSIKIKLDSDTEYDINDIVGAKEDITGISVYQPITKKIITVENGNINIDYEIGDEE